MAKRIATVKSKAKAAKKKSQTVSAAAAFGASKNEEMQKCLALAAAASRTTAAVLIVGESGSGKSALAEQIHRFSARAAKPCLTVNCSAVPENLIEAELFGQEIADEQGGEKQVRRGKFELADGGTIILDEIGHLPLGVQAKLLRALETGEFERVGGEEGRSADVRLIATSQQDLPRLIAEGRFREDLFYRLNEIHIALPPLRRRREDLEDLAHEMIRECNEKFGKKVKGLSRVAFDYLLRHDFPGNLREMKALIKRAVTMAKGNLLWLEDFGVRVEMPSEKQASGEPEEMLSLAAVEERHIRYVLDYTRGNKKRASEILQISRPTLDRKIKVYGLKLP
ncbi:MAG: sigma-54 dependent transcriptional regulator [Planctomycetota bacterium]|nr:sigma-54 dependent transcriptional regulator [Planctomycetota bacterium]